jgi:hypothetical protein
MTAGANLYNCRSESCSRIWPVHCKRFHQQKMVREQYSLLQQNSKK